YIADNFNCLIRKIDVNNGMVSTLAGAYNAYSYSDNSNGLLAEFNQPMGIAISPDDSFLYITDSENQLIRKVNISTTEVTTVAGIAGSSGANDGAANSATFRSPKGICISSNGQILYIADAGNHKIRKLDLANEMVSTVAGDGTGGYIDNASGAFS